MTLVGQTKTFLSRASKRARHHANSLAERMNLPAWFVHLEESFFFLRNQFKKFCLPVKTWLPSYWKCWWNTCLKNIFLSIHMAFFAKSQYPGSFVLLHCWQSLLSDVNWLLGSLKRREWDLPCLHSPFRSCVLVSLWNTLKKHLLKTKR